MWAYCTAYKTPIGTTPFQLVYGKSCHLSVELEHKAYWKIQTLNFDLKAASEKRLLQLNELDEIRQDAYENAIVFQGQDQKMARQAHSKKRNKRRPCPTLQLTVKTFLGKLKSRWSEPFKVMQVFPHRAVEI